MIVYVDNGLKEPKRIDPNEVAVAIILTEQDKWNIAHMPEDMTVYCVYPEGMDPDVALQFIRDAKAAEAKE